MFGSSARSLEKVFPGIAAATAQYLLSKSRGDVLTHEMAVVFVNTLLALLEINRVRRQILVHNRMTVSVEIKTFLPN